MLNFRLSKASKYGQQVPVLRLHYNATLYFLLFSPVNSNVYGNNLVNNTKRLQA